MVCRVETNGTEFTCACDGCGIAYNHDTKEYTTLCCGSVNTFKVKNQTDDPDNPPKPGHVLVDFVDLSVLDAARLLERAAPGRIRVKSSFKRLQRRITFKANLPVDRLVNRLGLISKSK